MDTAKQIIYQRCVHKKLKHAYAIKSVKKIPDTALQTNCNITKCSDHVDRCFISIVPNSARPLPEVQTRSDTQLLDFERRLI